MSGERVGDEVAEIRRVLSERLSEIGATLERIAAVLEAAKAEPSPLARVLETIGKPPEDLKYRRPIDNPEPAS